MIGLKNVWRDKSELEYYWDVVVGVTNHHKIIAHYHIRSTSQGFSKVEEALNDFVHNDPRCPVIIRDEYIHSLKHTEAEEEAEKAYEEANEADLVPDETGLEQPLLELEPWMEVMQPPQHANADGIIDEMEQLAEDMDDQEDYGLQHDLNHD